MPPIRRTLRRPTSAPQRTPSGASGPATSPPDRRTVDIRIPVHEAEAHEFRLLQTGNETQHPRLLAPFELRLKPDEAVMIARQVVLPELHGRIRRPARSRIGKADGLHGPESQRVPAAVRHHFDRQAALEELLLVEVVDRRRLRVDQRVVEALVLLASSADNSSSHPGRRPRRMPGEPRHGRAEPAHVAAWDPA